MTAADRGNESKSGRKSILVQFVIVDSTVYMLIPLLCNCRQQNQLLYSSMPISLMSLTYCRATKRDI
jgi:hypothetical protein